LVTAQDEKFAGWYHNVHLARHHKTAIKLDRRSVSTDEELKNLLASQGIHVRTSRVIDQTIIADPLCDVKHFSPTSPHNSPPSVAPS